MRTHFLLLCLLSAALPLCGQIFTEITDSNLRRFSRGDSEFFDADQDGDLDLIMSGRSLENGSTNTFVTEFYLNDGDGSFVLTDSNFIVAEFKAIDHADIDGDGDIDLFIGGDPVSTFYINDGQGNFTSVPYASGVVGALDLSDIIEFVDYDNDGDPDLTISTGDSAAGRLRRVFNNDGAGNFTLALNIDIGTTALAHSNIFRDIDFDGDLDWIKKVTFPSTNNTVARTDTLLLNDGLGNFSFSDTLPFTSVGQGTHQFVDFDNDCDLDLVMSGLHTAFENGGFLYDNVGNYQFEERIEAGIEGKFLASSDFADIDLDGDLDFVLTGEIFFSPVTTLYINDGDGNFTVGEQLSNVGNGSVRFADVDGDRDPDLLITGDWENAFPRTFLYRNNIIAPTPDGNECPDAIDINALFGFDINVSAVSSSYDNYLATNTESDPDFGFGCFAEPDENPLYRTLWYSFTGDGFSYSIRTRACSAFSCRNEADTQLALYSGEDCADLSAEICNDNAPSATPEEQYAEIEIITEVGREYRLMVDAGGRGHGEFCLEVTHTGIVAATDINDTAIEVYPNPTNGLINISGLKPEHISVFDHVGRRVMDLEKGGNLLELNGLPVGLYLLKMFAGEEVYSAKIVKE